MDDRAELFKLAQVMFDTKLPTGVTMLQPFAEDSFLKKIGVQVKCKDEDELKALADTEEQLRHWAPNRGQTLTKTGTRFMCPDIFRVTRDSCCESSWYRWHDAI